MRRRGIAKYECMLSRAFAFGIFIVAAAGLEAAEFRCAFDGKPVPRYSLAEFAVEGFPTDFEDPLDEREVAVQAEVLLPDGGRVKVDGFLDVPCKRTVSDQKGKTVEKWDISGPPQWKVRFAPWQTGNHQLTITARSQRTGAMKAAPVGFQCVPGKSRGLLRLPPRGSPFLRCDDGKPWLLIGENMCWSRGDLGMTEFDKWLPALAKSGGNFVRLWMEGPGNFRIEPRGRKGGKWNWDFRGPARLDYLLDQCNQLGVKAMLCLLTFGDFRLEFRWRSNPPSYPWLNNPYNAVCGGPCEKPEDFWTHPEAQRRFKEYLRYWVARFGGHESVGFWEFWNEVDIYADYEVFKRAEPACTAWHEKMGGWLRSIDPYRHIITTSFAGFRKSPIWEQPHIELVQTHSYGRRDLAGAVIELSSSQLTDYPKPHLVGEIGNDVHGDGDKEDRDGVGLHNGLWSGLVSGSIGGSCVWWWDGHVHPCNLYSEFAGIAKFAAAVGGEGGEGWSAFRWPGTNATPFTLSSSSGRRYTRDLRLQDGAVSWQPHPANQTNLFVISRAGELLDPTRSGTNRLAGLLHGLGGHKKLHNPVTFQFEAPKPLSFIVNVDGVSGYGGANLHIALDGKETLFKDFADPDGSKNTATLEQFNGPYSIQVPAGRHRVTVENTGRDWVRVGFSLPGYLRVTGDKLLRVAGLVAPDSAVMWVQNTDATWANALAATNAVARTTVSWPPEPVPGVVAEVRGLQPGRYQAQLWDTQRGEPMKVSTVHASGGKVKVPLPPLSRDIAIWLRRQK